MKIDKYLLSLISVSVCIYTVSLAAQGHEDGWVFIWNMFDFTEADRVLRFWEFWGLGDFFVIGIVACLAILGVIKYNRYLIYAGLILSLAYTHWGTMTVLASKPGEKVDLRILICWSLIWIPFAAGLISLAADLLLGFREKRRTTRSEK